ncbi:hypothetical protein B296_00011947 [Ensete ventricosum]|uniref:Uncharacterized protein n=1 Tax=Ensete ventricosum TaxID=4639 RepID=A0A427B7N4_ENSVE|nr:hypothetical protein B296_00011947 [Ensete ventricosum]
MVADAASISHRVVDRHCPFLSRHANSHYDSAAASTATTIFLSAIPHSHRFTEGIRKLAENTKGDHRKKTKRLAARMPEATGLAGVLKGKTTTCRFLFDAPRRLQSNDPQRKIWYHH